MTGDRGLQLGRRRPDLPGRDLRAVRHGAAPGRARVEGRRRVAVIGGGIAGLAGAALLAERGAEVVLLERDDRLGGRVAAWPCGDGRTMSRGFHAFFRQYYSLRSLLRRADPGLERLVPVPDYPLVRPGGLRDSFARIPRTPPWSVLGFVAASPSFTPAGLARVRVPAAVELLQARFPGTHARYEGESAAEFLDRLRFPEGARDLALEVFARSFFADPRRFSAGELVSMFHAYFVGSAEGLVFDVPDDDYDTALWGPLGAALARRGVALRTGATAAGISPSGVELESGELVPAEAVVLAADPASARALLAAAELTDRDGRGDGAASSAAIGRWREGVASTRNAPPFVVVRLWLDGLVAPDRPAFLGTSGFGRLDNVSVLERFERGAAAWSRRHGGSVVELHAYACPEDAAVPERRAELVDGLERELHRAYPETASLRAVHREVLVRDDCALIEPEGWPARPGVRTPAPWLVLAGDWVRTEHPVALMERAASTGFQAANALLERWGVRGQDLWTVPTRGLLAPAPGSPLSASGAEPGGALAR